MNIYTHSVLIRWCKKPGICGRDVIRESAYCYVEGSFCQKWINRTIRNHKKDGESKYLEQHSIFDIDKKV